MTTRTTMRFEDIPTDYAGLVAMLPPRPIHDEAELENFSDILDVLAVNHPRLSPDQHDYLDLLSDIVEKYEDQHRLAEQRLTGVDLLAEILDEAGLSGADLSRLLDAHRTLGPMILRRERSITAEHARVLGDHFKVDPGAFIRQ